MRQHALVLLLLPTVAFAVPMELDHQGRLLDTMGAPLQGEHTLHFAMYTVATLGSPVWQETHPVVVQDGYYHQRLGSSTPLDSDLFAGGTLYLAIAANESPANAARVSVVSVPFAVRAADADNADVASSVSQDAALDIASIHTSGDIHYDGTLQHGEYDHRYDYPFYRLSTNQVGTLSGTGRVDWSNNTGCLLYTSPSPRD